MFTDEARRGSFVPGVVAAALLGGFACISSCSSGSELRSQTEVKVNPSSNAPSICLGRFQFAAPEGLTLEGRTQSIYRVDVMTEPLPAGRMAQVWERRLHEIRSEDPPPEVKDRIIRTYTLKPDIQAVLYHDSADTPRPERLDGMKLAGNYVVSASRFGAQGQEADMETLVKHVLDAFAPELKEGFCVEHGSITSEAGNNEATQARFTHPALPDFEINFGTQTVRDPASLDELSDAEELRLGLAGESTSVETVASKRRVAAGLEGLEERFAITAAGEPPFLRYSWKYPGESMRGDRPSIMLRAVAHREHEPKMTEAWETILASLRQVAMAGQK